ncbi:ion transport peptide-like [Ctenocephalides felis]|uniref:ion transport peptide-like n=1 Tax=Ctenocephalides felis TaxID=7515 RepID=UPI000E6E3E65|nr:ion transport peptide-like [Ctenocephalides felis]
MVQGRQHYWVLLLLLALVRYSSGGPLSQDAPIYQQSALTSDFSPHSILKRSFFDIQCKGVYDKGIFARLDRICEDCYNLFREPQLHALCKKECFTTDYFKGCMESLQLNDEIELIQTYIKQLHGAEPDF